MTRAPRRGRPPKTKTEHRPDEGSARKASRPVDALQADEGDASERDAEFFEGLKARMPEPNRRAIAILERVKGVYVRCRRDAVLAEDLNHFLALIVARKDGRRDDGRIFFVTGESGAGKSRAVEQMIRGNDALAPQRHSFGPSSPIVSVSLSGPMTLRILGQRILREAGYPIRQNKLERGDLWDRLPDILHHRHVLIVHIDETQHMIKETPTDRERKDLADALKGAMNNPEWPVSFIMSGLPRTTEISRLDEQFERRGVFAILPDVALPSERPLVHRIIQEMCTAGEIDPSAAIAADLPDRIAHAANYRFGRIAQVVLAAIQITATKGDHALVRDHFARAYLLHSHARGHDEMNPFLASDWRRLPPGAFIIEGKDLS